MPPLTSEGTLVLPVKTRAEMKAFIELPYQLYRENPSWVPLLRLEMKAALSPRAVAWRHGRGERTLFLAWRNGKPVGRISCHVHHAANRHLQRQIGYFGLLDSPNDPQIVSALLERCSAKHRRLGCTELRGPYTFTANDNPEGMLVDGFAEQPVLGQAWNPPYLPSILDDLGFSRIREASTYKLSLVGLEPESLLGVKQRRWLSDPTLVVRSSNPRRAAADAQRALALIQRTWSNDPERIPLDDEERTATVRHLKSLIQSDSCALAELGGEPIGVVLAFADNSDFYRAAAGRLLPTGWWHGWRAQRKARRAVIPIQYVDPRYQSRGLALLLLVHVLNALKARGFDEVVSYEILDKNHPSIAQATALGMERQLRTAVFTKVL